MKKYLLLVSIFVLFLGRIFYLNVYKGETYQKMLMDKTNTYFYGNSAPRGRILDRNGKVLVDNKGIKTLYYTKEKGITKEEELDIAYKLANIINININEDSLKNFWLIKNNNGDDLISEEEWDLYAKRKSFAVLYANFQRFAFSIIELSYCIRKRAEPRYAKEFSQKRNSRII